MTSTDVVISISGLGKCYRLYEKPIDRLKQAIFRKGKQYFHEHWALQDVSLDIREGEIVGIVGRNGAGKTTLLRIVAGILAPTTGQVQRHGNTFAILELGSGFNPEFTGRDNIRTSGMILGLSSAQIDLLAGEIIAFADIGEYIDEPLKTYSTGMHARLAMAVALHISADLLLIDEILSVGDVFFQMKCFDRVQSLMKEGRTTLLCSHDLGAIRRYCSRVVFMEHGRLVADGQPDDVLTRYLRSGGFEFSDGSAVLSDESIPQTDSAEETEGAADTDIGAVDKPPTFPLSVADEWQPDEEFARLVRSPRGLAFVDGGNVLVADTLTHSLVEITREGKVVGTWGRIGFEPGALYNPVGLERLQDGGVAVADYSTSRLTVVYRSGEVRPLFDGLTIGDQPFIVRCGTDGTVWISCAAGGSMWTVTASGKARMILPEDAPPRYITDVAFAGGEAFLTDLRNDEILVCDEATAQHKRTISLSRCTDARGPSAIAILGDHFVLTCHDSHSMVIFDSQDEHPEGVTIDLRDYVINHPCCMAIDGDRAYVSASTLGSVTAFDISNWSILGATPSPASYDACR